MESTLSHYHCRRKRVLHMAKHTDCSWNRICLMKKPQYQTHCKARSEASAAIFLLSTGRRFQTRSERNLWPVES